MTRYARFLIVGPEIADTMVAFMVAYLRCERVDVSMHGTLGLCIRAAECT